MDIIEFGEGMPDDERSGLVVPDEVEKRATELDSIIADLGHALEFLAVRRRVAEGMLENFTGSRIYLTEAEWQSETTNPWDKARQIHAQAHTIEGAIAEAAEAINRLQTSINILEPWRNLDSPVESIEPSKHVVAMLATADVRMYRASLESAQEQVPGLAWQVISEGREGPSAAGLSCFPGRGRRFSHRRSRTRSGFVGSVQGTASAHTRGPQGAAENRRDASRRDGG